MKLTEDKQNYVYMRFLSTALWTVKEQTRIKAFEFERLRLLLLL